MRIVVTGNIGCGKSTVCQALLGRLPSYDFVSVDDLARGLYQNEAYLSQLQAWFGTADRKAVAQRVFGDAGMRQAIEELSIQILGPVVDEVFSRDRVLIEFPLFYEKAQWVPLADFVIALGCAPDIQWARVQARDGLSREAFERVVAAQLPTAVKRSLADAYIDTGRPLGEVLAEAVALADRLVALVSESVLV